MKNEKLKHIFKSAYNTVPYFNNKMNDLNIDVNNLKFPEDFYQIGTFSKEIINTVGWINFINQEYIDKELKVKKTSAIRLEKTSGTTREPMDIPWLTNDFYLSTMNHWRYRANYGIYPSSKKCSNERNQYSNYPFFIDLADNNMIINKYFLSLEKILFILDNLYLFRPEWLYIQPSLLFLLVKVAKENHKRFPDSIRYIEYIGEPLNDYYRNFIEEFIQVPTSNMYGCVETNGIAYECSNGSLHLLNDNVLTEILDENDYPVFNKLGNVCVTGYYNTLMPMIRYKLNDKAMLQSGEQCGCGNTNPIIKLHTTRLPEFLIFDNKQYCSYGSIYYPFNKINIIKLEKNDIIFSSKLISIDEYKIVFYKNKKIPYDNNLIISSFNSITAQYGLSEIKFNFTFSEFKNDQEYQEYLGLLRL